MTSDTFSTEAAMSGGTSVPPDKPAKVRGQMKDGRRRSWTSIIVVTLLAILWTLPTLGLLVTSFRDRVDASRSGWWTLLWPGNWTGSGLTLENYSDVMSKTNPKLDVSSAREDAVVEFPNTTVADLVEGLHRVRVDTRGMISILQAIKAAGALHADIIVQ